MPLYTLNLSSLHRLFYPLGTFLVLYTVYFNQKVPNYANDDIDHNVSLLQRIQERCMKKGDYYPSITVTHLSLVWLVQEMKIRSLDTTWNNQYKWATSSVVLRKQESREVGAWCGCRVSYGRSWSWNIIRGEVWLLALHDLQENCLC